MSLAALGCNPEDTGASLDDVGGHQPGTLAFSPDGGLYCLIQASEACAQYDTCFIHGNWQVGPYDNATSDEGNRPLKLCIPQVELANAAYGWGLVFGNGFAIADADIDVSMGTDLYGTGDEGKLTATPAATGHISGMQVRQSTDVDESDNPNFEVAVQWPMADLIS